MQIGQYVVKKLHAKLRSCGMYFYFILKNTIKKLRSCIVCCVSGKTIYILNSILKRSVVSLVVKSYIKLTYRIQFCSDTEALHNVDGGGCKDFSRRDSYACLLIWISWSILSFLLASWKIFVFSKNTDRLLHRDSLPDTPNL